MRITQGRHDSLTVRGTDTVVPSLAGQIPRLRVADSRIIVGQGFVQGAGSTEADQRADFLGIRQAIDALMRGDQVRYVLEQTDEDGSVWTITVQPLRVEWDQNDAIPSRRDLACYWLSVDPDWVAA